MGKSGCFCWLLNSDMEQMVVTARVMLLLAKDLQMRGRREEASRMYLRALDQGIRIRDFKRRQHAHDKCRPLGPDHSSLLFCMSKGDTQPYFDMLAACN